MADKVEFELVSPEKLLTSQPVDMVVVPGSEGDFGVLAGHSPMISTVRPGVIDVYEGDRIVDRVFVAVEDTVRSFKAVVDGEYDHLPEAAFYMVGGIEEAVAKAEKLAQEA